MVILVWIEEDDVAIVAASMDEEEVVVVSIVDDETVTAVAREKEAAAADDSDEEDAAAAKEEEAIAAARLAVSPPRIPAVLDPTALGPPVLALEDMMVLKVDAEVCRVVELDAGLGCAQVSPSSLSSPSLFCTLTGHLVLALPSRPFQATRHTPPGRT